MSFVCPIHDRYVADDARCPYCIEPEAQPEPVSSSLPWALGVQVATPGDIRREAMRRAEDEEEAIFQKSRAAFVDAIDRRMKRLEESITAGLWGKP